MIFSSPAHKPNCKSQMGNSRVHNSEAQTRVFLVTGEAVSASSKKIYFLCRHEVPIIDLGSFEHSQFVTIPSCNDSAQKIARD